MVADMEVDKVADIDIDMEIQFGESFSRWSGNWAKTFSTQCLPGLRIF